MPFTYFAQLAEHHQQHLAMTTLRHAANFYCDFYLRERPDLGHACFGHDILAFVYLVAPELFATQDGRIRVQLEGMGNGQTMMDKHGGLHYAQAGWEKYRPETRVCLQVDAEKCLSLIKQTLESDWLRDPLVL